MTQADHPFQNPFQTQTDRPSNRYLFTVVSALLFLLLPLTATAAESGAEPDHEFQGFFAGLGLGSQNVIGGSLVGGRDVLASSQRGVQELALGWQQPIGGSFRLGVEFQRGWLDGDLSHVDDVTGATIEYENDSQIAYGLTLGRVIHSARKPLHLFVYAFETERDFDVTIRLQDVTFGQSDEQGLLRFGLGAELRLQRLGFRLLVGTQRADFGDAVTNVDPDGEIDVSAGLIWSFGRRR